MKWQRYIAESFNPLSTLQTTNCHRELGYIAAEHNYVIS